MSRVFTEYELDQAGRLTVDLIAECLARNENARALELVDRFQLELMTMFYSYTGWEVSIGECITQVDSPERLKEIVALVEDYEAAPERQINTEGAAQRWIAELGEITALIESTAHEEAIRRAHELRDEALKIHDGVMSRVVAFLSAIYEDHGIDTITWVFSEVMKPESMDPDGSLPFREKVENILTFTRCHLLPFSVTEDDEKVTFMPDPCPSGARLIREGHYDAPRNSAIVRDRGPLTYGRKEMPIYCCHEPSMELVSALRTGVPLFIVDPPEDVGISPCKIYVYKDPANIPERYYQRLGLEKPEDLIARSG